MSKPVYSDDESIEVNFWGLPGNRKDWLGLFESGASHKVEIDAKYTDGKIRGKLKFHECDRGSYEARLFFNDSFTLEATVSFIVN